MGSRAKRGWDALRVSCAALLAFGLTGCADRNQTPGDVKSETDPAAGPPIEVRVEVAEKEFASDAASARAKYGGKTVIVEGQVADLARVRGDGNARQVVVKLKGNSAAVTPCYFRPEDEKQALGLSWDQTVKIRGRTDTANPWLVLYNCTVESAGPDPSIRVTVAEVIREYGTNFTAAKAKYSGKPLTLVDAVVKDKIGPGDLILAVEKPPIPRFSFHASRTKLDRVDDALFDAVKPGDRITINCRYGLFSFANIQVDDCRILP